MSATQAMSAEKHDGIEQREADVDTGYDVGHSKEWSATQGKEGAEIEHKMGLWEAMKIYPGAITWSVLLSTAIIMEGYDIVLIGNLMGQPSFQQYYGTYRGEELGYQISAPWQSGIGNATACGTIFGAFANGWLTQRFGYRKTLLYSLAAVTGFIFITFFAKSLPMLMVGSMLCGLPWGVFATMAPSYASEICPMALRGYLSNYVCMCWALGQLLSAGVLNAFQSNMTSWAFRIPFAVQWVWPIPLAIVLFFVPESPYWLARRNRLEEAERVLARLSPKRALDDIKKTLAMIVHTNKIEDEISTGSSYADCFRKVNLRRTEIVCMVFVAQNTTGVAIGGSPVYFFVQAGVSTEHVFKFATGALGLASIGVIISWFLIGRFGRRTLYLWSAGLLFVLLMLVGVLATVKESQSTSFAQAGFVLLWEVLFYSTIGPICYTIIGEVPAVGVRSKSICIARIAYYISQIIVGTISPFLINPTAGNWKGRVGYFWAGSTLLTFIWIFFRLPETKDRTFEEIDLLFHAGTPARNFAKTSVDAYADAETRVLQKGSDNSEKA